MIIARPGHGTDAFDRSKPLAPQRHDPADRPEQPDQGRHVHDVLPRRRGELDDQAAQEQHRPERRPG